MSKIGKFTVERRYHRLCTEPNGNFKSLFNEVPISAGTTDTTDTTSASVDEEEIYTGNGFEFYEEADGQMSVCPELDESELEPEPAEYGPYPFNPYVVSYCDEDDEESCSPNFLRRISYGGTVTAVIIAAIPIFLIGYVLFHCIEEVISDS